MRLFWTFVIGVLILCVLVFGLVIYGDAKYQGLCQDAGFDDVGMTLRGSFYCTKEIKVPVGDVERGDFGHEFIPNPEL